MAPGSALQLSAGMGEVGPLIHPQVGPHASPGTEPPFRRKAKLPKQINQSVKKKPWRKNLSTVSAKKLKGELFPETKEETTDTFFAGPACGRPSRGSLPLLPTCPPRAPVGRGPAQGPSQRPPTGPPGSAQAQSHLSGGGRGQEPLFGSCPSSDWDTSSSETQSLICSAESSGPEPPTLPMGGEGPSQANSHSA